MTAKRQVVNNIPPVDPDNFVSDFHTRQMPEIIKSQIYCHMLCVVTKYTKGDKVAKVKPLPKMSDGKARPEIPEVIVPYSIIFFDKFMETYEKDRDELVSNIESRIGSITGTKHIDDKLKYKPLKKGCVVNVAFFDREIDGFEGKSPYEIHSRRMHSMTDAIIESVVEPNG